MRTLFMIIFVCLSAYSAAAHEVRPASLTLTKSSDHNEPTTYHVAWKQPLLGESRLVLTPVIENCTPTGSLTQTRLRDVVQESWTVQCEEAGPKSIIIKGLERTLTDVFVSLSEGETARTAILRPGSNRLDLVDTPSSPVKAYLKIGVVHVLMGWDHLLFIIGLVLLVRTPRRIIAVATAFTLAHSLSLALAALGVVSVPGRPVEILIAASIVLLAIEVMSANRIDKEGHTSLTLRRPYLVVLTIGLVHGLGFAGAITDIGLPRGQELLALLIFNIGVEIGQVFVIMAAVTFLISLRIIDRKLIHPMCVLASYIIGTIGVFWVIERLLSY